MINQVTLVGRLTKDPELRVTPEGGHVTNVILAVSRHFRNQNGEIEADFVQCTLWNKAADNTVQYCRKGSVVGITGRLQTRHYDNREGKRVFVTEVIAESIRFLSAKPSNTSSQVRVSSSAARTFSTAAESTAAGQTVSEVSNSAPSSAAVSAQVQQTSPPPVERPQAKEELPF